MKRSLPEWLAALLSPLSLAAFAAWIAVWLGLGPMSTDGAIEQWVPHACVLLFLLLFVAEVVRGDAIPLRWFIGLGLLMGALAVVSTALTHRGATPILLVLLAPMMAGRLSPRMTLLVMGVINVGLAVALFGFWPGQMRWLAISFFAYTSFQLFSGMLMRYARQAERMSERLQLVNAELISARSLLEQSARDSERLRLSRELHDVAGHALTALKLNLGALVRDARQPDKDRVQTCATLADDLLQSLRGVVRQMREHEGIDLSQAITQLAAPFPRPQIELDIGTDARVDDLRQAEALLRTVQEGLTNAVRHSGASRLWLCLRREASMMMLEIRDNGCGPAGLAPGSGLCGMRERLEELGGTLSIDRGTEGGLRLLAQLPAARA